MDEETLVETTEFPMVEATQPISNNFDPQADNVGELKLVSVDTDITRVSANNTNGFKSVVLALIGDYEMVTKEYTYTGNNGYTSKQVTTESDYAWMISAGIMLAVLYCFLRMLGGAIFGKR